MKEEGLVSKIISNQMVEVEFLHTRVCKDCGRCGTSKEGLPVIEAFNPLGAKAGDRVEVEFSSGKLLGTSFVLYIVPLLVLIIGYYIGEAIGKSELSGILASFIGFFFSILIIKSLDDKLSKSVSCRIIRVL